MFCGNSYASDTITPEKIFSSASSFWNFTVTDSSAFTLSGDVELGVPVPLEERQDSFLRGGDASVVKIKKGGYLTLSNEANESLKITGSELTFGIRVKCSPDVWNNSPLFSKHGGHERLAFNMFYLNGGVAAEVGTSKNIGLLHTQALLTETRDPANEADSWHDVYCRINSAKMELFLDGRCYDEDFVLGEIRTNDIPFVIGAQYDSADVDAKPRAGFEGEIDFLAIWNRALSDEEILILSGGLNNADSRQRTERCGDDTLNYWTPPNCYGVGDCMPFYADGTFHFMYLLDKNRHGAKNGLGAHQWIQATSTDLIHWTHQPFVIPIDDQNEGSICTGSVFFHENTYYAFYANRTVTYVLPNGESKNGYGLLCMAKSVDGVHFEKQDPKPLFFLPEGYSHGTRDPIVFKSPSDDRFHMYATTSYYGKGCWAHAVSDDLVNWELLDPVYTHRAGEPECPDWFKWGDDYYVIANHLNGYYKMSKSPLGPWEVPNSSNVLMNGAVNVPKTAPFGEERRIICGWTRERGFGGSAVFHELVRFDDGTLGEKFVPEMIPETLKPVVLEQNVDCSEKRDFETPEQFRLKMVLSFDPADLDTLRDVSIQYADGAELRIVFSDRAVFLNEFKMDRVDFSLGQVDLDMIATGNIVDVCVNKSRTVTDANRGFQKRMIKIHNEAKKKVVIESLEIAPLKQRF